MNVYSHSLTISLLNVSCLRTHAVEVSKLKTLIKTDKTSLTESQIFVNDDTGDACGKIKSVAISFNLSGERFKNLAFFAFVY